MEKTKNQIIIWGINTERSFTLTQDLPIQIPEKLRKRLEKAAEASSRFYSSIVREGLLIELQRLENKFLGRG